MTGKWHLLVAILFCIIVMPYASAIVDDTNTMSVTNFNGTHGDISTSDGNTTITWPLFAGDGHIDSTAARKYGSGSLALDGAGDYASFTPATTHRDNWTIEMWVNISSFASPNRPLMTFGSYVGQGMMIRFDSQTDIGIYSGAITGGLQHMYVYTPTNEWAHYAITKNGSTIRGYKNGTLYMLANFTDPLATDPAYIGYFPTGGSYFPGMIDDFRLSKVDRAYGASTFPVPAHEYVYNFLAPLTPNFIQNNTEGFAPLTVMFNDTSTGSPTLWNWSIYPVGSYPAPANYTTQNITHTFLTDGNYTVNMTAAYSGSPSFSKLGYVNVLSPAAPIVSFAQNKSYFSKADYVTADVRFNTTSAYAIQTMWNWSFGDGTWFNTTTPSLKNTTHSYPALGSYTVTLYETNAIGTNSSRVADAVVFAEPDISILPSSVPISNQLTGITQVAFNNITRSDYVLANITFNNTALNVTAITLNTSVTNGWAIQSQSMDLALYPSMGWVKFNITKKNSTIATQTPIVDITWKLLNTTNITQPLNYGAKIEHIGIIPNTSYIERYANFSVKNPGSVLVMNQTHTKVIWYKNSVNLNTIKDQTVSTYWWGASTGSTTTTTGYATISSTYGYVTINASADGYFDAEKTILFENSTEDTLFLSPLAGASGVTTWYSPQQVKFKIIDENNKPIVGARVNATVNGSTLIDNREWLLQMYGLSQDVIDEMLNSANVMESTTSDDGTIVFVMIATLRYDFVVVTPTGVVYNFKQYPKDEYYLIYVPNAGSYVQPNNVNNTYSQISNASLTFHEPSPYLMTLGIDYYDPTGLTRDLQFVAINENNATAGTYTQNYTNVYFQHVLSNITVYNIRGDRWIWYYNAYRTG